MDDRDHQCNIAHCVVTSAQETSGAPPGSPGWPNQGHRGKEAWLGLLIHDTKVDSFSSGPENTGEKYEKGWGSQMLSIYLCEGCAPQRLGQALLTKRHKRAREQRRDRSHSQTTSCCCRWPWNTQGALLQQRLILHQPSGVKLSAPPLFLLLEVRSKTSFEETIEMWYFSSQLDHDSRRIKGAELVIRSVPRIPEAINKEYFNWRLQEPCFLCASQMNVAVRLLHPQSERAQWQPARSVQRQCRLLREALGTRGAITRGWNSTAHSCQYTTWVYR